MQVQVSPNQLSLGVQRYVSGLDVSLNYDFPRLRPESEMVLVLEERPMPASGSSHTAVERRRDP